MLAIFEWARRKFKRKRAPAPAPAHKYYKRPTPTRAPLSNSPTAEQLRIQAHAAAMAQELRVELTRPLAAIDLEFLQVVPIEGQEPPVTVPGEIGIAIEPGSWTFSAKVRPPPGYKVAYWEPRYSGLDPWHYFKGRHISYAEAQELAQWLERECTVHYWSAHGDRKPKALELAPIGTLAPEERAHIVDLCIDERVHHLLGVKFPKGSGPSLSCAAWHLIGPVMFQQPERYWFLRAGGQAYPKTYLPSGAWDGLEYDVFGHSALPDALATLVIGIRAIDYVSELVRDQQRLRQALCPSRPSSAGPSKPRTRIGALPSESLPLLGAPLKDFSRPSDLGDPMVVASHKPPGPYYSLGGRACLIIHGVRRTKNRLSRLSQCIEGLGLGTEALGGNLLYLALFLLDDGRIAEAKSKLYNALRTDHAFASMFGPRDRTAFLVAQSSGSLFTFAEEDHALLHHKLCRERGVELATARQGLGKRLRRRMRRSLKRLHLVAGPRPEHVRVGGTDKPATFALPVGGGAPDSEPRMVLPAAITRKVGGLERMSLWCTKRFEFAKAQFAYKLQDRSPSRRYTAADGGRPYLLLPYDASLLHPRAGNDVNGRFPASCANLPRFADDTEMVAMRSTLRHAFAQPDTFGAPVYEGKSTARRNLDVQVSRGYNITLDVGHSREDGVLWRDLLGTSKWDGPGVARGGKVTLTRRKNGLLAYCDTHPAERHYCQRKLREALNNADRADWHDAIRACLAYLEAQDTAQSTTAPAAPPATATTQLPAQATVPRPTPSTSATLSASAPTLATALSSAALDPPANTHALTPRPEHGSASSAKRGTIAEPEVPGEASGVNVEAGSDVTEASENSSEGEIPAQVSEGGLEFERDSVVAQLAQELMLAWEEQNDDAADEALHRLDDALPAVGGEGKGKARFDWRLRVDEIIAHLNTFYFG